MSLSHAVSDDLSLLSDFTPLIILHRLYRHHDKLLISGTTLIKSLAVDLNCKLLHQIAAALKTHMISANRARNA